ncbi:hypothetical protein ABI069_14995, partial [Enterococcus faecium]|uniref:hypothetical protein n=1 Tax=Enterococcus faecium TaxID=1352 RepID=UPI003F43EBF5
KPGINWANAGTETTGAMVKAISIATRNTRIETLPGSPFEVTHRRPSGNAHRSTPPRNDGQDGANPR